MKSKKSPHSHKKTQKSKNKKKGDMEEKVGLIYEIKLIYLFQNFKTEKQYNYYSNILSSDSFP